jgi:hypothetical protein
MSVVPFTRSRRTKNASSTPLWSGSAQPLPSLDMDGAVLTLAPDIQQALRQQILRFVDLARHDPHAARSALEVGECLLTELGA